MNKPLALLSELINPKLLFHFHFRYSKINLGLVICLWVILFGSWTEVEYQATFLKLGRFTFLLPCLVPLPRHPLSSYSAILVFWLTNSWLDVKADENFVWPEVLHFEKSHYWESAFLQHTNDWINKTWNTTHNKWRGTFISESPMIHDPSHMNKLRDQWDRIFEIRSAKLKILRLFIPLEIRLVIYIYHSNHFFLFLWGRIIIYIQKSA